MYMTCALAIYTGRHAHARTCARPHKPACTCRHTPACPLARAAHTVYAERAGRVAIGRCPVNVAPGCANPSMALPLNLQAFWTSFVARSGDIDEQRFYGAFAFGDSKELANSLAELVMRGVKCATAGSLWAIEARNEALPKPGDLSVVTDGDGRPLCVIETISVEIVPFEDVSAEFAATEGEGDGSLEFWRQAHTGYFTRECARLGRTFSVTMPVACETFKVVFKP